MADLTYAQLKAAVDNLAKNVAKDSEKIRVFAQQIGTEATEVARTADLIGAKGVDKDTVAETELLSKLMYGLSQAAIEYASAGDTTSKAAGASHDQVKRTHAGIQEAFTRSPVDLSNLNREWLRQE
jgi:hypothetical protein